MIGLKPGGNCSTPVIRVTHFVRKPSAGAFSMEVVYEEVRRAMPADVHVEVWPCRHSSKGIIRRCLDLWHASRHQSEVNHVTGDVHYLTYLMSKPRTVVTFHDVVAVDRTKGLKRLLIWFFWYWLPARRAAKIVVISEATKKQVLKHVRCAAGAIEVIHNPVGSLFEPSPKTEFPAKPRMLVVGTTEHKNLVRMFEAAYGIPCTWVVIGRLSSSQRDALRRTAAEYENYVDLTGEQVLDHYKKCDIVAFASTYEGFGLPIIEAQAVGRPVVTSNVLSMPEVAGAGACLVDPFDVQSIRRGFQRVIEDKSYREQLVAAGFVNVERFRPAAVAERYADLYRRVARTGGSSEAVGVT